MPVERLDHFTILCADIERARTFYGDVLGFTVGPRPNLSVPGYWLYCGGIPQVHLVARGDGPAAGPSNGAFDHVAFRHSDPDALVASLKTHDIPYTERVLSDFCIRQIVVTDPDGITVELNCNA